MVEYKDYLLITSSLYKRDVLNLLCLPEGVHYRFRYRERWVQKELTENPSVIECKRGLIIYFYGVTEKETPKEFIPIREVTIDSVQKLGDILYVKFITGKLFNYDERGSKAHPNPNDAIIKNAVKEHLVSSSPFLNTYILLSPRLQIPQASNEMLSWSALIHWLWDLTPFLNASFLKIVRVMDEKGTELKTQKLVGGKNVVTKGYLLTGGRTFKIELLQRTSDDLQISKPFVLKLKAPESIISISNPLIVGKYDKLDMVFAAKHQLSDVYSEIALEASERAQAKITGKDETFEVESPDPAIPIKIKRMSHALPMSLIVGGIIPNPLLRLLTDWNLFAVSEFQLSLAGALGLVAVAGGIALFRRVI